MFGQSFLSNPILREAMFFGVISGAVGTAFTLASILIRFDRWVWLRLFDLNGISMFSCCLIASVVVVRQTGRTSAAVIASVIAGVIGCLIYTGAQWAAPYALFDHLVHYPFLHEDFSNSGIPTIKAYLVSEKGYWGVVGTTVGMLQYALPFCVLLASVLGLIGSSLGSWSRLNPVSEQ